MASVLHSLATSLSSLNPLPSIGRNVFLSLLQKLRHGQISIVEPDGTAHRFGGELPPSPETATVYEDLAATLTVKSDSFWTRLVLGGDMGFAEAYMAGDVDVDNMMAFLMLMVLNKPYLDDTSTLVSVLTNSLDYLMHTRLANTLKNSLNNISAHYDLSNDMFEAFLDERMMYSCGVWDWSDQNDTLEAAQLRKLHRIIDKAKLTPSSKLLEIGTGWGALAIEAVHRSGGCHVVTVTLSVEQKALAEARIRAAEQRGYIPANRIEVLLCDYRRLPERFDDGHFDALISIEMIEAVGKEYLTTYFNVCHRMLHPRRGIMVLQGITMPETRYDAYSRKCDFIQRYIFPGGFLPSVTDIARTVNAGSGNQLIIEHMENFAPHYARTLQAWRARFVATYPRVAKLAAASMALNGAMRADKPDYVAPSVATEGVEVAQGAYASVDEIEGLKRRAQIASDTFFRKFLYYFDYCAAGFATRVIDVYQVVLSREGCERLLEGPFARGDLRLPERAWRTGATIEGEDSGMGSD
ncbi:hypothetical protein AMAG_02832 [Allomyces macrogynus ATCC 38327]|uniref:Cyclopropane-fatty-acyl-phospholipid synthase n=1 Tax=Allomyces macrogynus (strain ATCC 38327) TaxID=578462 RepID=A0A0L0S3G0_ALLM3|nr:hypothetical protein AMAG_02832 [Allomyces macrogynus ATCC 38327]|eukprot:KNE57078.1 hypothetical protein AMAG_02832 [Allomyces macrogynus ATCC 38327]